MKQEEVIIVGGGPCGLAAAIALQEVGINPLVIEKGNIVNAIYHYPTHQTFFSSSDKLEIGDVAFITETRKANRSQALAYYREVVVRKNIRVNAFEKVLGVQKEGSQFLIKTDKEEYIAGDIVLATGYYDQPNLMDVPGEDLPKVFHYFKEAHPYFDKDVVVVGLKNSGVDTTLELVKAGARVTVLYRGYEYSPKIKPWILPEFEGHVRNERIKMEWGAVVKEITEDSVVYVKEGEEFKIDNDFVFAMTGYHPDKGFLEKIGINIDELTGRPVYDEETMETNVEGIYIAGVLAAGNEANEIFIENGRFHGGKIATSISNKKLKGGTI
ncbi:YpdA family putative bacillithiol disulfide reductase [Niallia sp. Krafla_26]|uniref:YpdA family putative bacillithiol disulfide reductase n=1 Tax=Niallia sp. Krafla_26 TaxID=3064703 RepID=UPI003D1655C6